MQNAPTAPLTVAQIPALVREVDVIVQTIGASHGSMNPEDLVLLCESLLARIEEIDAFRQTLRAGPLEAIVQKQIARLSTVLENLHARGSKIATSFRKTSHKDPIVLVDTRRRRHVVLPVAGSRLIRRASSHHIAPGSVNKQTVLKGDAVPNRHPKPIYKWEKRRAQHVNTAADPTKRPPHHHHHHHAFLDDDVSEACMELRPCREPGHYVRSLAMYNSDPHLRGGFEFQIILTEAEVQALKFLRRQLQAEQRHLMRQQQQKQQPKGSY